MLVSVKIVYVTQCTEHDIVVRYFFCNNRLLTLMRHCSKVLCLTSGGKHEKCTLTQGDVMPRFNTQNQKFLDAMNVLRRCFGERGVWADPSRYADECRTRDFALAIQPLLLLLGERDVALNHLINLRDEQQPNGQIPILFLDNEERWLANKRAQSQVTGRKFMLQRYEEGRLWNLTPGTTDSELHYILAVLAHFPGGDWEASYMRDFHPSVVRALEFVEQNRLKNGLFVGCDWRDTMEEELGNKPLLTNNALLYRMYLLANDFEKAQRLKQKLKRVLGNEGTFGDYPAAERFDPLGLALAVLNNLADPESYPAIVKAFRSVDSPFGVTIKCRHKPLNAEEAQMIEETDGVVVWPFVVGFVILALLKMEHSDVAREQFNKLLKMDGFREYYDPRTGIGYGAAEQLWSAALYLRAYLALI